MAKIWPKMAKMRVSKKLSFSRFAKENPILKCKILHFKMGFSFANFKKDSFFETPP